MTYEQDLIKIHDAIRRYNLKHNTGIIPFTLKTNIAQQMNCSDKKAIKIIAEE